MGADTRARGGHDGHRPGESGNGLDSLSIAQPVGHHDRLTAREPVARGDACSTSADPSADQFARASPSCIADDKIEPKLLQGLLLRGPRRRTRGHAAGYETQGACVTGLPGPTYGPVPIPKSARDPMHPHGTDVNESRLRSVGSRIDGLVSGVVGHTDLAGCSCTWGMRPAQMELGLEPRDDDIRDRQCVVAVAFGGIDERLPL